MEVRPGQKVTPEQRKALDALSVAPGKRVPSVGVVEIWGAWARVMPDGQVQGTLRLRRCEPEEASRFDDLARHIDLGEGRGEPSADDRSRLESVALRMNADLLRTAEELSELSKRGRSAIVRRCLSAMDGSPAACSEEGIATLVGRVKNDDLKVGERTRHAILWLLLRDRSGGVAASDADGDVVDWVLRHEEAREGLTGVISACDDLFREVTGHRPSSTLSSRLDRASAMRYVVESTRVPTAARGEAGRAASATMVASAGPAPDPAAANELARMREQVAALEARLEAADRARQDAQDTTRQLSDEVARLTLGLEEARRHNERLRQGAAPASQRGAREPEKARVEQREPPNAALTPTPAASEPQRAAPGQPRMADPVLTEPEPEPAPREPAPREAPPSHEDRFFESEALDALEVPDDLTFPDDRGIEAPSSGGAPEGPRFATTRRPTTQSFMDEHLGGDGRLRALVVGVAIVLLLAAVWLFFRSQEVDRRPLPEAPPEATTTDEGAGEGVRTAPPAAPERIATAPAPQPGEPAAAPDAGAALEAPGEEIPDDGPLDPEEVAAPAPPAVFKPSILIGDRSKVLVKGERRALPARGLEGADDVLNECVFGEVANPTGKTYRGYTPVRIACDGATRAFCRSLGCSDDAIVCHTQASAIDTCDPTKPVDPWEGIAPDEVAGTPPAGFRPVFRIRSSSKVYSRGTGDAVSLDTLPGGLEVENRCVFAQSSKDKTHRRLYPGYEHLALFCAGPQSALCKALGCGAPGELCHLVASGVVPCSTKTEAPAAPAKADE